MTRRAVSLLLLALAFFTARFAQAQRGGGRGGVSVGHAGAGSFGAGSRGAFSPSFSPSPQAFRSPSMPFGSFSRGPNSSRVLGYSRPGAPFRANNPAAYASHRREPVRRPGYGGPYFYGYGYGNYLVPNLVGYPFGYGPFFDDDDQGQADESASPPPPQQEMYAPPEDYAPEPPYPQANEEPSDGYRPAYRNSGNVEPLAAQPPTTLVFQDGRPTEQVHNYVLTRTTLYDLDGNGHSDIPLAALNLPATIEANRSLGIDFSLPAGY